MKRAIGVNVLAVALCGAMAFASGCGGGGGGSDSTQATSTSFPYLSALTAYAQTGAQKTLTVSGTAVANGTTYPVSGSLQITQSAATSGATFNGQAALQESLSITGTITVNGTSVNVASTATSFLSTSYNPLGETSPTTYCVASTAGQYPATVTEGMTGTIATFTCYTDSTKTVSLGSETLSYSVSPGSSSTVATVAAISQVVNTADQQTASVQVNYALSASGTLTLQSIAIEEVVDGVSINVTAQ